MFFGGTEKIIEAIATVKADTKNHNGELKEFKDTFNRHISKEDKESIETNKTIQSIQKCLSDFKCPNYADFKNMERRYHDSQKVHENRRITDGEERAKEKALELKERAGKDEEIAKEIASLRSTRKYNYASISGLYILIGVILKKIFTS